MPDLDESQKLALQIAYLTLRHEYIKADNNESVNLDFLREAYWQLSNVLTVMKNS